MERPELWYIFWDGNSVGPWSTETVLDHLRERKLTSNDRIIGEGETEWRSLRDDPFFSRHIKRKPRRKERLKAPKTVRELIQERKQRPALIKPLPREPVSVPVKRPSRSRFWLLMLLVGILLVLLYQTFETPEKMRGPEEKLPNPPGPATAAPEESDPNSLPKPPTRPERP